MRKLVSVCLALLFVSTGCGGSSKGNPASPGAANSTCSGGTAKGTMSARIDGVAWTATCITVAQNDAVFCKCVAISGGDSANPQLAAAIGAPNTGPGTYPIGGPLDPANANVLTAIGGTAALWTANAIGGSGSVTITTLTAAGASGTFAFNAIGGTLTGPTTTKVVTQGVFNVTF